MVRPTAQRRRAPQQQRHHRAHHRRGKADADAHGKAGQGAGEHIPSHPVGAEEMRAGRHLIFDGKVGPGRVLGQQNAAHRHRRQQGDAEKQQEEGSLPPVVSILHRLAAPLRMRGSTAPYRRSAATLPR